MRVANSLPVTVSILVLASLATEARSSTISVARDGSGDYTVVFDAVEAAASGDTILIATGEYPEVRAFMEPGGQVVAVARVTVPELTIIGVDRDSVILGPEIPAENLERGPVGISTSATGSVRVQGLTIRNCSIGVWGNDVWVDVDDCHFVGNDQGVTAFLTGFATVSNSSFIDGQDVGVMVFAARGGTGALVEGCTFDGHVGGVDFQPANCEIRDCTLTGGVVGIQASFGGTALIQRCSFDEMLNTGIAITGGAQGFVYDCRFTATMTANIGVSGRLVGSGNTLGGGTYASVYFPYASVIEFSGNHILNGGGFSVRAENGGSPPVRTQDFSGNYWGTTDIMQIDEWIYDRNDIHVGNFLVVEYLPIADQRIPTEATNFGELKARYKE